MVLPSLCPNNTIFLPWTIYGLWKVFLTEEFACCSSGPILAYFMIMLSCLYGSGCALMTAWYPSLQGPEKSYVTHVDQFSKGLWIIDDAGLGIPQVMPWKVLTARQLFSLISNYY